MLKLLEVKMTCCFLRKMLMFGVKHPVIFIRSFGMFYFEAGIRLKFPVFASGISFK